MKSRFILVSIIFIFSSIANAQTDAPNKTDTSGKKQGHWIKYDDNHKKIYDGYFMDNIPVGKFTYYYDTSIPWSVSIFCDNGKVTRTQMFDAGGKLIGEGKYVNQKKDSIWKFYNSDGKLISDGSYVNGLKNGIEKVYFPNGQVAQIKNWKNGVAQGSCQKFFETGQLRYDANFINDRLEGKVTFYHPSGKIDAQGVYTNDLKEGNWIYFDENGKSKRTDIYINGRLQNGGDKDVITKEQQEKEKKQYEQFEIKDPFDENYNPK